MNTSYDLDKLAEIFTLAFPQLDQIEKKQALILYRLLSLGKPVTIQQFAESIKQDEERTSALLNRWTGIYYDDNKNVVGFWGLSVAEMQHQFIVDGRRLYTWCAWDTLFLPMILNYSAEIISTCPVSNTPIHLTVSPESIISANPQTAVLSFIQPDLKRIKENVTANFCHQVYFLASANESENWHIDHPDSFILSLEDGFRLGKNIVKSVF